MGNKSPKELQENDYDDVCNAFDDYFKKIIPETKDKINKEKNDINNKIDNKEKKAILLSFIKKLIESEKKGQIFNEMQNILVSLSDKYKNIHKNEDEKKKNISDSEIEKNFFNAIYISKLLEDEVEDAKIHDYAEYLYGDEVVKEIEEGNNKNVDEIFKKFNLDINNDEMEEKFNELCKEKGIDPKNYENKNDSSQQNDSSIQNDSSQQNDSNQQNDSSQQNDSNKKKSSKGKKKEKPNSQDDDSEKNNKNSKNNNFEIDKNLNKNEFNDKDLFNYYDIIFDIDSLDNLKKNGWQLESKDEGYKKYMDKKDKKNTVVSVIGNKNKGKSFILAKLSNIKIPDGFNITTKGLSVIYPEYEDHNVIFLDTAGFEIPLCENDEIFKFETKNENYLKLNEEEKKKCFN